MSNFVLYGYFRSSTSYRIRIALNLKNIDFKYEAVHLLKEGGAQFSPEYKKLNPASEVPTLVHGDYTLAQSVAIAEYLDVVSPEPRLYPQDPELCGQVRQFCEHINSGIHPYGNNKTLKYLMSEFGITENQKEKFVQHWFDLGFKTLERILASFAKTYCFGDTLTAADTFLVPAFVTAQRFNLDMSKYPLVQKVVDNCNKLPAFIKAHPFRQIDTPEEMRIL
jgi:maleylacetoacetate isomerase